MMSREREKKKMIVKKKKEKGRKEEPLNEINQAANERKKILHDARVIERKGQQRKRNI